MKTLLCLLDTGKYLDDYSSWDGLLDSPYPLDIVIVSHDADALFESKLWDKMGLMQLKWQMTWASNSIMKNPHLNKLARLTFCENHCALHVDESVDDYAYFVQISTEQKLPMNPWEFMKSYVVRERFCLFADRDYDYNAADFFLTTDYHTFSIAQNALYFARSMLVSSWQEWEQMKQMTDVFIHTEMNMTSIWLCHLHQHLTRMEFMT